MDQIAANSSQINSDQAACSFFPPIANEFNEKYNGNHVNTFVNKKDLLEGPKTTYSEQPHLNKKTGAAIGGENECN